MTTYEINLWLEKKIIEKIIKQFEKDEDVLEYIKNNFDTQPEPEFPSLDPERGYTRPKASKYIITWAKVHTYVRRKGPTRIELTEDEKEVQKTLEASITKEAIDEWGKNEMLRLVRKEYWSHPDATGQKDYR
jgi:hypothetical protein